MKDVIDNNLIRFTKISKTKDGLFANFKAKGIKGGTSFTASVSVDISEAEVDLADSLEKIIEESARVAVKEFKNSHLQFEGLQAI
jgi:hypothetical protein